MVAADPLASLAIREIFVTIGGREYLMAPRPAIDWLEAVLEMDLARILPAWLGEEAENFILDQLADDKITLDELKEATLDAFTVAAGRPWWWAEKLILYAGQDVHHWSYVNGRMMLAGIDVTRISLAAWVDAAYAVHVENKDDEGYQKFRNDMDMPPSAEELDEEAEADAFMSMLG